MSNVDVRAMFSGIEQAKGRRSANYVRPGRYWLNIKRCKADSNRSGENFLAVEMQVLTVLGEHDENAHKPLEEVTHMLMTKHDSFKGNVKAMIANIFDVPEAEVNVEEAMAIVDESQPLANTVVEINAYNTKTKRNTDFTVVDYIREVPIAEVAEFVSDETLSVAFPGDALQTLLNAAATS